MAVFSEIIKQSVAFAPPASYFKLGLKFRTFFFMLFSPVALIVYLPHRLTIPILVALPGDDSQPTVMLICSGTRLMVGSLRSTHPLKNPAAAAVVVIAVERQRHQTKQTISRNCVFTELKECCVYPAQIQEVDGHLAA